jgi:SAM-dependent methyltransferase
MMSVQELFQLGMKRKLETIFEPSSVSPPKQPLVLNLGSGNSPMPQTVSLDYPAWNAECDPLPYDEGEVDAIYAFHFFEHLSGKHVIELLRECQRVLRRGGLLTVVIPHRLGQMAYQDLDHKSYWTEETWRVLFSNPYYNKNREEPWKFLVSFNAIVGVNERNLALCSQLIKGKD